MSYLGFPLWVRLTHWFQFLLLALLVRSGIEILAAHPKLYWKDDSLPLQAWLKFTRKRMPAGQLWTSADEDAGDPRIPGPQQGALIPIEKQVSGRFGSPGPSERGCVGCSRPG